MSPAATGRQPQLDVLRALAVLLVLFQHTTAPEAWLTKDAGAIGVMLFFVLSGFLITGILLDARGHADSASYSRRGVLGRFYARRFLRIFPLYYGVLLVAWLVAEPQVREYIGWLVTYRTNFLMATLGHNIGMPTPFWSLAVEEQFYLFWPLVVLWVAPRRLPWVLVGMVTLSVGSRMAAARIGVPGHTITMPTWAALDGLAIGGLLALAHRSKNDTSVVLRWVLFGGLTLAVVRLVLIYLHRGRPIEMGLWMLPWGMIGAWLVDRAARDRLPALFRSRALAWIGVISYGVYVFHRPVMSVLSIGPRRGAAIFLLVTGVTLVVASASWLFFERPINNQKRRWPYVPHRPAPPGDSEQLPIAAAVIPATNPAGPAGAL